MKKFYLFFLAICFALGSFGQKFYSNSDGRYYEYNNSIEPAAFQNGNLYLKSAAATEDIVSDTVIAGSHDLPYEASRTRGYYFQAQSSFTIEEIMCAEEGNPDAALQSVEVVSFGETLPVAFPGPGSAFTTLFSAISAPSGWIPCNAKIEKGKYYGIIGAKHNASGPMFNSYGYVPVTVNIDGFPTQLGRFVYQYSLFERSPAQGDYMSEPGGSIGRINIITSSGCPKSIEVDNEPGKCGAIVNYTEPTADGATVTQIDASGLTSGDEFPGGTTIQQYKLDFGGGVIDTCTFSVIVNDMEAPVITCPDDIVVSNDPGECGAVVTFSTLVDEILLDEVLPGSLSEWGVNDTGGNPVFSAIEIESPYDGSTAIKTSVDGNTYAQCPSQSIEKWYNISGNTDETKLKVYLEFTSTMDAYNFPYILVLLYDNDNNDLGGQFYYGKGVISGIYANYASNYPDSYTELSASSGDFVLDLSKIGSDIDFSKIKIIIANYACIGQNSIIFDHLRVINSNVSGTNNTAVASDNCLGVSVEANIPSGSLFPIGTTPVTLTATDASGNKTSCSFNVTVEDTEAPVITCPEDIEVFANLDETCAVVNFPSMGVAEGDGQSGITLPNAQYYQGGVAYNPVKKLYYAVQAGYSGYTLYTYDENGAQLAGNIAGFDFRGLWWNPNTSSLEGNSYGGYEGYRRVDLDANGYALSTGTNNPASNYQPNDQSQADYDYDLDEVIYFNDNTIYRTSRSTGELIGNTAITGLPDNTVNSTFVGYTGIAGKEILIYDYINKMVYFVDKTTGNYSSSIQLPDSAPGQEFLNTSYANGHIWISDGTLWHSFRIAGNSEDNCGTPTVTYDYASGTCFPIGTTEVTVTVKDEAENTFTCSFNVTVVETVISNLPPVIVSAEEVYVWAGDSVTLDASETYDPNDDRIDFKWTHFYYAFLDKVVLINPNDLQLSFIAPEVEELTLMPIRLRVSDGLESSVLIIKVYVKAKLNDIPLAHAGEDLVVNERESGMLDGTASSDVDGNPLTYLWNSGFLTLDDVTSPTPAYVVPEVHADTTIWVTLVVNDGKMDSETDSVQITIKQVNRIPVAEAGVNLTVNEGEQVTFNASGSSDPDGDELTYNWSAEGQTITDNDQVSASLIAPEVDENTTVPIVLVVSDGQINSAPDTIWVSILQVNKMPVWIEVPADTAFVGHNFSAPLKIADPDQLDVLSIFSDELPEWLVITDHGDGTATISTDSVPRLESLLGTHSFIVKASDGTATIDTLVKLTITIKTGIADWKLAKLSIYPNPTSGIVHLDFNRLPAIGTLLQVYNQLGQTIAIRQIDEQNSSIDLSAHPAGMYYFKVNSDGSSYTEKIIRR